jgi:hypothetical protein
MAVFGEAELTFASLRIVVVAVIGHVLVRFSYLDSVLWPSPDPLVLTKRELGSKTGGNFPNLLATRGVSNIWSQAMRTFVSSQFA